MTPTEQAVRDYPETVELTVVAKRCVYINDHRICGGKPYVSENLPQHSFTINVDELLFDALGLNHQALTAQAEKDRVMKLMAEELRGYSKLDLYNGNALAEYAKVEGVKL